MRGHKRKICFPILNRNHFARQRSLLDILNKDKNIELQLVVGGSAILDRYGNTSLSYIKSAGFPVCEVTYNAIEGGNHIAMAKTAGLISLEFANIFHKLDPDVVLIRGDRFEQLALTMAAAYLNKTVAHIEGGDLSGNIDESIRHAITKLAHLHFVTNDDSRRRLIRMGENPRFVFNVGSPDVEVVSLNRKKLSNQAINAGGTGSLIDLGQPYFMVMYHPVTTDSSNLKHTGSLLSAVDSFNMQAIWFWPNNDAGTDDIAKAIRLYRELGKLKNNKIRFITDVAPDDFIALLRGSSALIGNSSSGIKECSYLGVPVVNVGTRQQGRLRGAQRIGCGLW